MGRSNKKTGAGRRQGKHLGILLGIAALAVLTAVFALKGLTGPKQAAADTQQGGDVQIVSSGITETARFIPYDADGTYMELIAVRAPDGTVRTAFNTCQVCFDSGRGYYVQEGDELVCQNCGNRFAIGQIEKQKDGCNPVPILESDKTDDGTTITIPEAVLTGNKSLFARWGVSR